MSCVRCLFDSFVSVDRAGEDDMTLEDAVKDGARQTFYEGYIEAMVAAVGAFAPFPPQLRAGVSCLLPFGSPVEDDLPCSQEALAATPGLFRGLDGWSHQFLTRALKTSPGHAQPPVHANNNFSEISGDINCLTPSHVKFPVTTG